MDQNIIDGLDKVDKDWSSEIETVEDKYGAVTVVKVHITIGKRRRTGIASVFYDRSGSNEYAVTDATQKAFRQAANQYGVR